MRLVNAKTGIIVILLAIFIFPVASYLSGGVTITNFATISTQIIAASGSAADIQTAVNIAASRGGGNVYIPAGTFNFVPVGHWYDLTSNYGLVTVPAGVNIIGATAQTYANGSVISWSTILVCPWDVPSSASDTASCWFFFQGSGNPNKPSRFSNIELEGYRAINPGANSTSDMGAVGIIIDEVMNYRVDHCYFNNICAGGIWSGWYFPNDGGNYSTQMNGVIDHCSFANTGGAPADSDGTTAGTTDGYGVALGMVHNAYWDSSSFNIFGHYTNCTTIIEDCWFSMWRHDICNSEGSVVIVRFCTFGPDFGFHTIDNHGIYNLVPGRSVEVYNCTFTKSLGGWGDIAIMMRAGSGLFYNNTVDSSYRAGTFVVLSHDSLTFDQSTSFTPNYNATYIGICHDIYVWSNNLGSQTAIEQDPGYTTLGVNDFASAPAQGTYTPYPYPCPLTLGS